MNMHDNFKTFQGIIAICAGTADVLQLATRPLLVLGAHEVLIAVHAAGVNRADIWQRQGHYPPPSGESDVLGLEVVGKIVAVGAQVTRWQVDDCVMALVASGGYATVCRAHEDVCMALPSGLSMVQAAALPEGLVTVWHNVFERGQLQPGEWLLVHGGNSGIGAMAIQMGKAWGAHVVATARGAEKCAFAAKMGADEVIDTLTTPEFAPAVKAATNGHGADVTLDMVGGAYIGQNYASAAVDGRIVNIAFQAGNVAQVDFSRLMLKRLTHTGSTLRSRSIADKSAMVQAVVQHMMPHVEAGRIAPQVFGTYPLAQAAAAHVALENGAVLGKLVLVVE